MARGLTKKQKGFVKDYVKTGNGTVAAFENYDTEDYSTASMIASENLSKPKIIKALADRLPDDLLEEKHLALLNKEDAEGNIDVQAVSKGLDMGYKLKGSYAAEKSVALNLNFESRSVQNPEIEALRAEYEKKLQDKFST